VSLARRVASAAVLIPLLAAIIVWAPPVLFALGVAAVILLAAREWFAMHGKGMGGRLAAFPLLALIPPGLALFDRGFWGPCLALCVLAVGCVSVLDRGPVSDRLAAAGDTAFSIIFIGIPLGHFVLLRLLPRGRELIFFLLFTLWLVDTAAYFVGVNFGRRRLAPVLSPGKTVEGLAAALAGGALGAVIFGRFLLPDLAWQAGAALGMILALLGQASDLFESLWKRALGAKDSGTLIPGHGGMLDRIDSFLFTAPALYYLWLLLAGGF
jgi:phosphatidate cytidylyltransferase